jgi:hypothetical protein
MGRERCGRPTADGSARLDLAELMRRGAVIPGQRISSDVMWVGGLRVRLDADMRWPDRSALTIEQIGPDEDEQLLGRVRLEATKQHFGGCRWWFVCPHSGRRARVLLKPRGSPVFASRHAFERLDYRSQRETPDNRTWRRARKIRAKLGIADMDTDPDAMAKPYRMRTATFERLRDAIYAADEAHQVAMEDQMLGALAMLMGSAGYGR